MSSTSTRLKINEDKGKVMQLLLTFQSDNFITTDDKTIRIMQGFLYKKLADIGASYIHHETYSSNSKVFRHFCFSDLICKDNNYHFYFSSALDDIIPAFCQKLYQDDIYYEKIRLKCTSIEVIDNTVKDRSIYISTKSPVVVDRTIHLENGKKKRIYYSPLDDEFLAIVKKNLIDKYNSIHQEQIKNAELSIKNVQHCKKVTKKYIKASAKKPIEIIIKGYEFDCEICGDKRLLQTALNSGLGAKNAQGFGFVKKIN